MKYDPEIHHRRSIRLHGHDYSQAGAYFVTVCTHNHDLLLQFEAAQAAVLSVWHALPLRFPTVVLDEFVIMSNHVHGIIILRGAASRAPKESGAASSAPTLGRVVRAYKSVSAVEANRILGRTGQPFWQSNYYEHIVRSDHELDHIRQYIRENPINWDQAPNNPSNL